MKKTTIFTLVLLISASALAQSKSEEARLEQCIAEVSAKIYKTGQLNGYGEIGVLGGLIVTEEKVDSKGIKTYTLGGGPLANNEGYFSGAYAGAEVQLDEESCVITDYYFEPGCLEPKTKSCKLSQE